MDFTFVLAVYNKLDLTKECYSYLRKIYPTTPITICSGGSTDDTEKWLGSLDDSNLKYLHINERISFSDTYNNAINLVETEKLVLIHNDMVIGQGFLESLNRLLEKNMILSYTTIEPPIFVGHNRPGKVLLDYGKGFVDFKEKEFQQYVLNNNMNDTVYEGAGFFMCAYKDVFDSVNGFDGKTFFPCFCEDDDFLLRCKLKGYSLKTCTSAITYHFVSQTSRFSDEMKDSRQFIELCSNKNFVRKWGTPMYTFNLFEYYKLDKFEYNKLNVGLTTKDKEYSTTLEPFFDKVKTDIIPIEFIESDQQYTSVNLMEKYQNTEDVDIMVYIEKFETSVDYDNLIKLRFILSNYGVGMYEIGNMKIDIRVSNL
jgi:GT2 family glycosyltransferase